MQQQYPILSVCNVSLEMLRLLSLPSPNPVLEGTALLINSHASVTARLTDHCAKGVLPSKPRVFLFQLCQALAYLRGSEAKAEGVVEVDVIRRYPRSGSWLSKVR